MSSQFIAPGLSSVVSLLASPEPAVAAPPEAGTAELPRRALPVGLLQRALGAARFARDAAHAQREGHRLSAARQAQTLQHLCRQLCLMHGFDVRQQGPEPPQGTVLVSNHLGYLDPIVLCALSPCLPIAKEEVSRWFFIGSITRQLSVMFVRRNDVHSRARTLLRAYRLLRGGVSVLNFPEGTTSKNFLLPFNRGAFWLAYRTGAPIVPAVMQFDDPDLCWVNEQTLLPHYARLVTRRTNVLRVRYLPAVDPRGFASIDALTREVRGRILEVLDRGL